MRVHFPRFLGLSLAAALTIAPLSPARAQNGLAGAYLAARHASAFFDFRAAAEYYPQVLARDPSNPSLLENAALAFAGLGQIEKAVPIARRLQQLDATNQVANLILLAEQMKAGKFDDVLADLKAGLSVGPLLDSLMTAWAEFGAGRMSEALAAFDAAAEQQGVGAFARYHKALALAAVGDFEGAAAIFDSEAGSALRRTRRGALAYIRILSQLGRGEKALALLDDAFGMELDPGLAELRSRIAAGEALPYTTIRNAADGAAEVYFTVASALNGEAGDAYTLLYSRLSEFLRPQHVDAILLSASLLETLQRHALAAAAYKKVPADDPAFYAAEMGRAETLEATGKPEEAIAVLRSLAQSHPGVAVVHVTLGDMLSRMKRFDAAIAAYNAAIDLFDDPDPRQWVVYYARGIAHERVDNWKQAEADFLKALDLSPGEPRVLNYLGYSYVEKGVKLDTALDMIRRAVEARPDSGYIVDSLAWALYRLGRYEEAVPHMERAAALMPVDPVVNDHLGDVLWSVGRKVEARFQWRRALSFIDEENPSPDVDPDRIRRKLEVGLDKVLAAEGDKPNTAGNGG